MIRQRTETWDDDTGEMLARKERVFPARFDEEKGYLLWHRKDFARSFMDVEFPAGMTMDDIGRMTLLAKRIWSQTNMLGYRGNGGVRPYGIEQIGQVIKCGPRQARRFLDRMIRLGLMARVKVKVSAKEETQWYINPVYFFSCNRLSLNLYLIFREQLDAVLPDWVKQKYGQVRHLQAVK